jgi:exodeoxyribonuclease-3
MNHPRHPGYTPAAPYQAPAAPHQAPYQAFAGDVTLPMQAPPALPAARPAQSKSAQAVRAAPVKPRASRVWLVANLALLGLIAVMAVALWLVGDRRGKTPSSVVRTGETASVSRSTQSRSMPSPYAKWEFLPQHVVGPMVNDRIGTFNARLIGGARVGAEGLVLPGQQQGALIAQYLTGFEPFLPSDEVTLSAWVRVDHIPIPDGPNASWSGIVGTLEDTGNHERGFILGTVGDRFTFGLVTDSARQITYLNSKTRIELGRWYHVAATYDGQEMHLYVNGECDDGYSHDGSYSKQKPRLTQIQRGRILYTTQPPMTFIIGRYKDSDDDFPLIGVLREVSLYHVGLTEHEVQLLYREHQALTRINPAEPAEPAAEPSPLQPQTSEQPDRDGTDPASLRVMSFNLFHGGEAGNQPFEQTLKVIQAARADIVGIQETEMKNGSDSAARLAKILNWHYFPQGQRTGIISRWPLGEGTPRKWGVAVKLPSGRQIHVFNAHLAAAPYQPYQLLGIPYFDAPFLKTADQAIAAAKATRGGQVERLLGELKPILAKDEPVFLTGDLNEPSFQDWTEAAAQAGKCPLPVDFPTTKALVNAGLLDAYRLVYPDEVKHRGDTWTSMPPKDKAERHDRIDYVFVSKGVEVKQFQIIGEERGLADVVVERYPSDHRAVVAEVVLPPPPIR